MLEWSEIMKNLLITGFEPFDGEKINPSWQAVSMLENEMDGYSITKLCIPVAFEEAAQIVLEKAKEITPDVIICVGQAGGRNAINVELVGINLQYGKIPDNKGNQPKDKPIIEGGNTAYFSTLPARKIVDAISNENIPSVLSYSAGAYVCNDVLYTLLAHFENTSTRVGFIHVPYSSEQNKEPSMNINDIAKALKIAMENLD